MIEPTLELKLSKLYLKLRDAQALGRPKTEAKIEAEIDRLIEVIEQERNAKHTR